jgi:tetratricopeptide (TPR) repeat protein
MMSRLLRAGAILAAATVYADTTNAEPARYEVGPAPAWVQSTPTRGDVPPESGTPGSAGGAEYLLSDSQVRVDDGWSQYGHLMLRITNTSGVSDNSNININFDPELDHLTVHAITLRRKGETIDELAKGRVEVLQRESGLEQGILDGRQTFHVLMSDVRVGDTIDYSYTLEHRQPLWGNRYFGRQTTQWEEPVQRSRLRVVLHSNAPIFVKQPPAVQPSKTDDGTWQSLEWNWHDLAGLPSGEEDTPSWYEQFPAIQLSQFASWKEIVDASVPMYSHQGAAEPELTAFEKQLSSSAHSQAARALAVIKFVQEEVRYTGLELGSGAYRPTPPVEVFRRRYGDCKDKVLLAVTMLRDLGIDAVPALVSTRWDSHLHEQLPSPGDFNHVVAKLRIDSKTYWIDLTSTGHGGDLSEIVQADFGEALVIAPGVSAPEAMPRVRPKYPLVAATAEFDMRAGYDKEASFTVKTVYRGYRADGMRRELRRTTAEEMGSSYLNFYKKQYSSIRAVGAPQVTDDIRHNELTVVESYRIEHLFEKRDDGAKHFEVNAEIIDEHLGKIRTPARKVPLLLEDPVDSTERIRIRCPEKFPVKDDVVKVETPYFQYDSRVSHSGNDVVLDYHYRTLTDTVPVEALQEFIAKRSAAYQDTEFDFNQEPDEQTDSKQLADAIELLDRASKLAQANQPTKADEVMKTLLGSAGFSSMNTEQQHIAVYFAAALAFDAGDSQRALQLTRRASQMKGATADDWSLRLSAAIRAGDKTEAASSLAVVAERWPEKLKDLDLRLIGHTVFEAPKTGPVRQQLLTALFNANFTPEDGDFSREWADLALLQLNDGDTVAARKTFANVKDPYVLISALSDNRFEPVRDAVATNIPAAMEQQIAEARKAIAARPNKLSPVVRLTGLLIATHRYPEALQVADDAVKKMSGPTGAKVYDDSGRYRVWLLDARSRALCALGRWDEGTAQLMSARFLPESGNANVSQTINLASLYNDMAKPKEAKQTLVDLTPEGASAYGFMQVAIERLSSADQLGDAAEVEKQLGFLREHREDSVATLQRGLISANRQDEAAQLLISRLQDPDQRKDALMEVQKFNLPPLPKRAAQWHKRWNAMVARPDVVEAIKKVGVVSEWPLAPGGY